MDAAAEPIRPVRVALFEFEFIEAAAELALVGLTIGRFYYDWAAEPRDERDWRREEVEGYDGVCFEDTGLALLACLGAGGRWGGPLARFYCREDLEGPAVGISRGTSGPLLVHIELKD